MSFYPRPTSRPAAGPAGGALGGRFPSPAIGLPPIAGPAFWDDFLIDVDGGSPARHGQLGWLLSTVGGTAPTASPQEPSAATEWGLKRLLTNGSPSVHDGGVLGTTNQTLALYSVPPPGSLWVAKLRVLADTYHETWSGFASDHARVSTGTIDFVGVRAVAAASGVNWYGVCRDGTSETTVDLGVSADTSFAIVGFEHLATLGDPPGSAGIQFFTLDLGNPLEVNRTDVGDPVTTNLPDEALAAIALGVTAADTSQHSAEIDFWGWGGRCVR